MRLKIQILGVIATAGVWMAVAPVVAHHSFSAEFDISKPITVTGAVTSVRWSNPHAWVYIDVRGDDGTVVNWAFETRTANALYRSGWRKDDLEPGTVVTIEGWLARNGTPTGNTSTITLPDGRRLLSGTAPSDETAPR
jgi:DNA/RNA endonuclease YhcR with UshA esterase domain